MGRGRVLAVVTAALLLGTAGAADAAVPPWAKAHRMTVLVDSVLLGGMPALRAAMPDWRIAMRGSPALMVRTAERDLRTSGARVAPLVVVGLGYNSLWERDRRNYGLWARRFDREAAALLRTLRARGARQVVWVTLREPSPAVVTAGGRQQYAQYAWYFPYVNARLRRVARRRDDVVIADWRAVSNRHGLTYDLIHLNPRGARRMAQVIERRVRAEARRQARRAAPSSPPTVASRTASSL